MLASSIRGKGPLPCLPELCMMASISTLHLHGHRTGVVLTQGILDLPTISGKYCISRENLSGQRACNSMQDFEYHG
ncbi:hypothetical protein CGRA01v4_01289 [Colletotrichum graminicola]|nr:hypothetical protein CGRA01v4_01289 [Colletotrichum graminicola]